MMTHAESKTAADAHLAVVGRCWTLVAFPSASFLKTSKRQPPLYILPSSATQLQVALVLLASLIEAGPRLLVAHTSTLVAYSWIPSSTRTVVKPGILSKRDTGQKKIDRSHSSDKLHNENSGSLRCDPRLHLAMVPILHSPVYPSTPDGASG